MKLLRTLWNDECGAILSAELVMVGTLGVVGVTVGLATVSEAVNGELTEFAMAIRSLDQSYCVEGQSSRRAWTAGSSYIQQDVEESLAELQGHIDDRDDEFDEHRRHRDNRRADDRDDRRRRNDDDYDDRRRGRYEDDDRDDRRRERNDDNEDRDDRRRER